MEPTTDRHRREAEAILELLLDDGEHVIKPGAKEQAIECAAAILRAAWNNACETMDEFLVLKGTE